MNANTSIGVRIHDIHHGLIQSTGAIIETEYDQLKTLGSAIQIATTIKDHETISDTKSLYAAAGELKISRPLAKESLEKLQELGYVRLKYSTGKSEIARIDIVIPDTQKIYTDFGQYFLAENKSELAGKTIEVLEKLSDIPHKEQEIVRALNIDPRVYDQIKDVCTTASLVGTYVSPTDSQSIIFSPLYWEDNPKQVFELLKKYSTNDFLLAVDTIKEYQGLPDSKFQNDEVLNTAITIGCLPTLSVTSTNGLKKFIFTPRTGVGPIEKNLLYKARVLISCVRYGENFAGITKILYPERLMTLLVNRGFLKAHSESLMQYEAARNLGLVKIIPSYTDRYEVHFIDNEENRLVARMALDMIKFGDTTRFDSSKVEAGKLLLPGAALHPTQTRSHTLKAVTTTKSQATMKRINDLLRGIE
ncbi:hypothetical protein [Pseudoflavitalea rhizosphaerae]|uniref:hypothetical protein n=1 Tax=Pseudoflavitalea rhizosphaerae TaxID=1884793 RepID=UPI000F8CAABA|nr:hypothetical protein [Pseudoflavitalea rhizosphaerae]